MSQLISVETALANILEHIQPLSTETVTLLDGLDRFLGEDIISGSDIPPFANSAMDGYAVRTSDLATASRDSPAQLQMIGQVPAGAMADQPVRSGTAIRIMTGAPIPVGADAVVRFEDTSENQPPDLPLHTGSLISVYNSPCLGENIRFPGEDIRRGQTVLSKGIMIRPQEIGVLASLGVERVSVIRRPRVAIIATGDELVELGEPLSPGKIRNSNEFANAALVKRYGGEPICLGIARDTVIDLQRKIEKGLRHKVDLFITSAGVSVGDYDMVKNVLAAEGEMHFWQVAIKPGKPLAFGLVRGVPLIGLPGNPVAAFVAFEVFARPAILKMAGSVTWRKPSVMAVLQEPIENSGRRHYMRALVRREGEAYWVTTRGTDVTVQGSGILSSMVWANAFLVVPEGTTYLPAGSQVRVEMLDWPEYII
ncbi:MAG: molybdopterin molybdenumtransferase MoeA [Chloroflexi bacterium]|nr:molybdopterin molybdenumtransferase MoeA [Chloroflexota bacterium]